MTHIRGVGMGGDWIMLYLAVLSGTYWMIFATISKISLVPFPTFLSSFATDSQTGEWWGSAATHRLTTSWRVSSVPCCISNFNHHAQTSPRSLSCANARPNHSRAFSILRSDQKILATVQITKGLSFVFRRASAERVFLAGLGSDQMDSVHKRPDSGHSCRPKNIRSGVTRVVF